MLEHGSEDDPNASPAAPAAEPPAQGYYTPPGRAEPLTGRGKPVPVKRFSRKMLLVVGLLTATVVTLAFTVGLKSPKKVAAAAPENTSRAPTPNDSVNQLPSTYADVVPPLGEPRPGDLGTKPFGTAGTAASSTATPRQLTPLEQYESQLELDRLRREDAARSAGVAFAGAGAAAIASASAGEPGEALQEKLLDLAQRAGDPGALPVSYKEEPDPNGQTAKNEFEDQARGASFDLKHRVEPLRSPYTLLAGAILPCVLTQGINSDLPGQIGCMISQNVFDSVTGKYLLVPQGTKAIGTYDSRVAYGQNRVLVVWTRLERPDGSTLSLEGMPGTDLSGYAGLTGHVNNHYLRLLSGVVLGSLIGASAQIATGANSQNPSFAALAAQGAGQNINEAGQQITRKNLNIQPTIEVAPGTRLNIFATKDLVLPPWTS
jgi:type IV secretion system protein VirB10